MSAVRIKVLDAGYEASVAVARDALGDKDFDSAWAEGAALSTEEAMAAANDIATRLSSPRTVQTHLTPVYTKLDFTSRVQLVKDAARHARARTHAVVSLMFW